MTVSELIKMIDTSVRFNGGKIFTNRIGDYTINFYEDGKLIGASLDKDHLCSLGDRIVARWNMDMPNINIYLCL